ncbi:MAG: Autotransporter-associated beta strand repeat protein, partial [Verrucomicrobiales bacterium]|nr:Autotransporter-associated beta strand repeat protein [Verrucomicrobiales bacterium]
FITAGTVALSATGNLTGTGVIDISSGATLDTTGSAFALAAGQSLTGDGSVVGNTTLTAGILAPGAGTASLDFTGDLALGAALVSNFEIQKTGITLTSDLAAASGALTLNGTLNVASLGGVFAPGDTWNLFDASSFAGNFSSVNLPGSPSDWDISNLSTAGTITFVPEPAGTALALGGLALLGARRRRRAQA